MNGSFDPRDPLEAMTAAWAKPGEPREPPTTNGAASWTEPDNKPIKVHDAGDIDVTKIPPRGWLLGVSFCRKFISGLVAEGGAGRPPSAMPNTLPQHRATAGSRGSVCTFGAAF